MKRRQLKPMHVVPFGGQWVLHVPGGQGEELRCHLAVHGITARLSTVATGPEHAALVVEGNVAPEALQAIVDDWQGVNRPRVGKRHDTKGHSERPTLSALRQRKQP